MSGKWVELADFDNVVQCPDCEDWWCKKCEEHFGECSCLTLQMADDYGWTTEQRGEQWWVLIPEPDDDKRGSREEVAR